MTTPIEHIVFDIGSVLIHYDPEIPFKRLIPDDKERRWFFDNVCTSAWNIEQDRGRSWTDAENLLIDQYPDHEDLIKAFRKHWNEMVPHSYDGSVAIFEQLIDHGKDLTMLTNFSSDTFREALEIFPFLKRPRGVTVSGDVKLIKPDPAIYELHTKTFGLKRDATFFIDDNPANIAAAKTHGWQAVLFTSPEQLVKDIEQLNFK
jgi:2-haloacid dehalogenase